MKFWYWLTQHCPRRLPVDANDWIHLQCILSQYFGVADNPKSWATIANHVLSTPTFKSRVSYARLANIAHRLIVNEAAHTLAQQQVDILKKQLADKMKEVAEKEPKPAESINLPEGNTV